MGYPSKSRGSKKPRHEQEPSQWSDWEWVEEHKCWQRYRLGSSGQYEFDTWQNTPGAPQVSSGNESVTQETYNINVPDDSSRGRSYERQSPQPDTPRDPSVDPDKPVKPGPPPPQTPQSSIIPPATPVYPSNDNHYTHISSNYSSATSATHKGYNISSSRPAESAQRQVQNSAINLADSFQITIKRRRVTAIRGTAKENFIAWSLVKELNLKKSKTKTKEYHESGRSYDIKEQVTVEVSYQESKPLEVKLNIIPRDCSPKYEVVLGNDTISRFPPRYGSSVAGDSRHGSGDSTYSIPDRSVARQITSMSTPVGYPSSSYYPSSNPPSYYPSSGPSSYHPSSTPPYGASPAGDVIPSSSPEAFDDSTPSSREEETTLDSLPKSREYTGGNYALQSGSNQSYLPAPPTSISTYPSSSYSPSMNDRPYERVADPLGTPRDRSRHT